MQEILDELNRTPGVRGSLVSTPVGVLATSALVRPEDQDFLAAMGSELLGKMVEMLREAGLGPPVRAVISAEYAKILLADLEMGYLAVLAEPSANADALLLEVMAAASRLRRRSRIGV
jgi:predicted regulator of Ras-like GTPase activity (Roadblock/LC7/MglB family)